MADYTKRPGGLPEEFQDLTTKEMLYWMHGQLNAWDITGMKKDIRDIRHKVDVLRVRYGFMSSIAGAITGALTAIAAFFGISK